MRGGARGGTDRGVTGGLGGLPQRTFENLGAPPISAEGGPDAISAGADLRVPGVGSWPTADALTAAVASSPLVCRPDIDPYPLWDRGALHGRSGPFPSASLSIARLCLPPPHTLRSPHLAPLDPPIMFPKLDLVLKNGIVVTAGDEARVDVGVADGKIVLLMADIDAPEGCKVVDVDGGYITPGLVDSHVHIAQSAAKSLGAKSADDWTTATRSALGGGCTTVIAFAVQQKGGSMQEAVDAYHELATGNALCDYSFHVIVTDPTDLAMNVELPSLIEQGITSCKIYSTYPALELKDGQIMDMFYAARQYGVTVM